MMLSGLFKKPKHHLYHYSALMVGTKGEKVAYMDGLATTDGPVETMAAYQAFKDRLMDDVPPQIPVAQLTLYSLSLLGMVDHPITGGFSESKVFSA